MSTEETKAKEHDIDYTNPDDNTNAPAGLKDVEKITGTEGEVCLYK